MHRKTQRYHEPCDRSDKLPFIRLRVVAMETAGQVYAVVDSVSCKEVHASVRLS